MLQDGVPDTSEKCTIVQAPSIITASRSPYPLFDRLTAQEKQVATDYSAARDHRNRRDQRDDSELESIQTQLGLINTQKSYWIRAFYNAIIDMTGFRDKPSTPGFKKLFNDKETFYNVQDILAGASRTWEVFFDGATYGWLRPKFMTKGVQQRIGKKPVGDWFTRLNEICLALKTEKKTCVEVIEDNLTQIRSLVFCPGVYVAVKQSYRRCNDSRQAAIAASKKEIEKKDDEKVRKRKRDGEFWDSSARVEELHCQKRSRNHGLESPYQRSIATPPRPDTHAPADDQLIPPVSTAPLWEQQTVRPRIGYGQEDSSSLVAIPRKRSIGDRTTYASGPRERTSRHFRRLSPHLSTVNGVKSFGQAPSASTSPRIQSSISPYDSCDRTFQGEMDTNDTFVDINGDRAVPDGPDNTATHGPTIEESHPPVDFLWDGWETPWANQSSFEPPGPTYQSYAGDESVLNALQTHGFGYPNDGASTDDVFGFGYGQEGNNTQPS
ncbi:hypothetical protein K490DRAFT_69604 [Saccharata proteae CBS 121410]|uniref:Uncharacterized protein n=1 Tax=Saccharata proteae CBS 121410 TaxID=1314787 RepID=A0A9P4HN73_9PEZI|nr:hypothetical protein K490DRAFT_69604 [Saccharata proteae CBS 121410]